MPSLGLGLLSIHYHGSDFKWFFQVKLKVGLGGDYFKKASTLDSQQKRWIAEGHMFAVDLGLRQRVLHGVPLL